MASHDSPEVRVLEFTSGTAREVGLATDRRMSRISRGEVRCYILWISSQEGVGFTWEIGGICNPAASAGVRRIATPRHHLRPGRLPARSAFPGQRRGVGVRCLMQIRFLFLRNESTPPDNTQPPSYLW